MAMWNATKAVPKIEFADFDLWARPAGTYNWQEGIEWNQTVPPVAGNPTIGNLYPDINPEIAIAEAYIPPTETNPEYTFVQVAYSLREGEEAQQLWVANRTDM